MNTTPKAAPATESPSAPETENRSIAPPHHQKPRAANGHSSAAGAARTANSAPKTPATPTPNSPAALRQHLADLEASINTALRLGIISRSTHQDVSEEITLAHIILDKWQWVGGV